MDFYSLKVKTEYELNFLQPKSSQDARFKPSNDVGKKVNEVPRQENKCKDQEEKDNVNNTNRVNVVCLTIIVASNEVNDVGRNVSIQLPDDPNMRELEDISIFEDSNEDVFGFEDPDFPNNVYKVEKALYELHQAPRAWYKTLSTYLLDNRFQRGKIDKTLFIIRHKDEFYGITYCLLRITSKTEEGRRLYQSRYCKKRTVVANSTTGVEYVAASSCCG
nr:retrotransposon protein, putative, unclassified [Tanacetum cinerariifolium]